VTGGRRSNEPLAIAVTRGVAERYGGAIRQAAPGARLLTPHDGAWPRVIERATVAYFSDDFWQVPANRLLTPHLFGLPELRWFHSFSAGVDHPAFRSLLERGVLLTNSAGASAPSIAQYVIAMMLRAVKPLDAWSEAQRERRWQPIPGDELTGKTIGIVGVGQIGGEVARLAKSFNMRVVGCRRRATRPRHVDVLVTPAGLRDLLTQSDFVVLSLPLSSATQQLIGARELAAMKPGAWLINVSRGQVVDQDALVRALTQRAIAGAALDVFYDEPLPGDHKLWSLPNAIVTPHNSGWSPHNIERATAIFVDNLARFVAGRPLRNRILMVDL
jgi:phosphoglycerate dehydrogenase-like enzyme